MTPSALANKKYRKKYPEKRNKERRLNYQSTSGPSLNHNWKAPWTVTELKCLFVPGLIDRALHLIIGRSVAAIQNQRHKLRKEKALNANK